MWSGPFPRFSVITPSFNQGHYLEETIQSVLSQNYPNLEFIIVDGGSTDRSVDIIKRYSDRITWWVSEPDAGQSDALNKGFRRCSGEIIAWLNSDDKYCPGALRAVAEFFTANPSFGAVIGDQEVVDPRGTVVDVKKSVPIGVRSALYSACAVAQPATFFTREAWLAAGDLDTSFHYAMDLEFFIRMMAAGVKFGVIRLPLAQFRLHANSKTILQHENLVQVDNRRVQDRYLGISTRTRLGRVRLRAMEKASKGWLYLLRIVLRGHLVLPFRSSAAFRRVIAEADLPSGRPSP